MTVQIINLKNHFINDKDLENIKKELKKREQEITKRDLK